ncbi:3-dehydro-L-gulonate 2-dehydrogenase [Serratia proteamaculans]|uniref:3-dehydro-L-gulonate 2-dehydrogenase n=1 Tax=Serratia proteamaculans TaxID=28151 RepID=UPI002178F990|nr:3-dehydro-L-gulonate 2-dehydrogenase [Serratia proteamaculans]CAI1923019.1 2,3-diketo-L-gulonate reductase [Serratia proteamaculans]
MNRIPFEVMQNTVERAFVQAGLGQDKAATCARIHTESSCDGIYSHGLNRVARFIDYLQRGWINPQAEPVLIKQLGAINLYDGQRGVGITNALFAVEQAAQLARQNGVGIVTMRNTTHWMRGGTYGWQAVNQGLAAICWTNTESCMPAWGGKNPRLGNNPFVMAVPGEQPLVLDMAMSQYSYGQLQVTRLKGGQMPFPAGYDQQGNITLEPGPVEESMRIMPTGYWKGSSMAILLDAMAAMLSAGHTTSEIDCIEQGSGTGASQIFMLFDPQQLGGADYTRRLTEDVERYVAASEPAEGVERVFYPGEQQLLRRQQNLSLGIPVDDDIWAKVVALAGN